MQSWPFGPTLFVLEIADISEIVRSLNYTLFHIANIQTNTHKKKESLITAAGLVVDEAFSRWLAELSYSTYPSHSNWIWCLHVYGKYDGQVIWSVPISISLKACKDAYSWYEFRQYIYAVKTCITWDSITIRMWGSRSLSAFSSLLVLICFSF